MTQPSVFAYDSSLGSFDIVSAFGLFVITTSDLPCDLGTNHIRFLDYNGTDPDNSGQQRLAFTGTKGCGSNRNRRSVLDVEITIVRTNTLIIFAPKNVRSITRKKVIKSPVFKRPHLRTSGRTTAARIVAITISIVIATPYAPARALEF